MESKKFIPSNDTNKAGSMKPSTNEPSKDKKTAGNNQWVSTGATPGKDTQRNANATDSTKKTGQQPK